MNIVWGGSTNPEINNGLAGYVAARIPNCQRGFGLCTTMGVMDGDKLIAALVYHNYSPEYQTIEISGAAETSRWMTRESIRAMFSYPFDQIGCQLVVARHSEHANSLRRMWRSVGAQEHIIPRIRGREEAEVVSTLTDDMWRGSNKVFRRIRQDGW